MVNLRFHDLGTLDGSKKYVLGLKLVSDDLAVNQEKSTMTFFLQQKQGEIDNPIYLDDNERPDNSRRETQRW